MAKASAAAAKITTAAGTKAEKANEAVLPGSGACTLDRIIHERLRLGIVSALSVNDCLAFGELKSILSTTDGNLSVHARKLEEAGYIACDKKFEGRLPRTEFRLTNEGRRAFEAYLTHMESLIRATRRR